MAILVDRAIWRWRARRWAHLVSDSGYAELHAFADRLGLRREWFQGDHYDVPEAVRAEALRLGAVAVGSRELVARLRDAGLRKRHRDKSLPAAAARPPVRRDQSLPAAAARPPVRRW